MSGAMTDVSTALVSREDIEQYIFYMEESGHSRSTIANYRAALWRFYQHLPEDGGTIC